MLSFQVMTEKDRREAAAIEKKRALEEERKKRIFNPHSRLIGVCISSSYQFKQILFIGICVLLIPFSNNIPT